MAESYETTLLRLKERAEEKRRHQQEERIKIDAQKAQLLRLLERIRSALIVQRALSSKAK